MFSFLDRQSWFPRCSPNKGSRRREKNSGRFKDNSNLLTSLKLRTRWAKRPTALDQRSKERLWLDISTDRSMESFSRRDKEESQRVTPSPRSRATEVSCQRSRKKMVKWVPMTNKMSLQE